MKITLALAVAGSLLLVSAAFAEDGAPAGETPAAPCAAAAAAPATDGAAAPCERPKDSVSRAVAESLVAQYEKDIAEGWRDPSDLEAARVIDRDRDSWERTLREAAAARDVTYDKSDLEGVIRHVSYARNAGKDPAEFLANALRTYDERAAPTQSAGGCGGDADRDGDCKADAAGEVEENAPIVIPVLGAGCHPKRHCLGADDEQKAFACASTGGKGWKWVEMRGEAHPCGGGRCDLPVACR